MNKLTTKARAAVVRCLVEGNSIRSTVRITGVAKNTIVKLLVELGEACAAFQNGTLVKLTTKRIKCDEIWSFVGCKEKNVPVAGRAELGVGDVWTWTAIDADSKLVVSWLLGERDTDTAVELMQDVASRLSHRVQLATDGHKLYLVAVDVAFEGEVDFATLIKKYGLIDTEGQWHYSPAGCIGVEKEVVCGLPIPAKVSTSYVERQNLTIRMGMRRFTRLTDGFSKKLSNHAAALSLHFMYHNFGHPHQTLKGRTPAMAAGIADHLWTAEQIVGLLDQVSS